MREALRCDLAVLGTPLRPPPRALATLAAWPPPSVTTPGQSFSLVPGGESCYQSGGLGKSADSNETRAVRVRAVISSGQSQPPCQITSTGPGAAAEA